MEKFTQRDRNLLIMVALFPVFADYIEDVELYRNCKRYANMFLDEVRRVDTKIMESDIETQRQQVDIQRAFRQWINEHFKID